MAQQERDAVEKGLPQYELDRRDRAAAERAHLLANLHYAEHGKMPAEYRESSLQRQLANDEPKCANCRHWFSLVRGLEQPIGNCDRIAQAGEAVQVRTTDLSVCSRWEAK